MSLKFKTKKIQDRFPLVHPLLQEILQDMSAWLKKKYNRDLTLSESVTTLEEDKRLKRVSTSHQEGRAVDGDVTPEDESPWSKEITNEFVVHFGKKYDKTHGALSKSGVRKCVVFHNSGHGWHLHIQIGADVVISMKDKYPLWVKPNITKQKDLK